MWYILENVQKVQVKANFHKILWYWWVKSETHNSINKIFANLPLGKGAKSKGNNEYHSKKTSKKGLSKQKPHKLGQVIRKEKPLTISDLGKHKETHF